MLEYFIAGRGELRYVFICYFFNEDSLLKEVYLSGDYLEAVKSVS